MQCSNVSTSKATAVNVFQNTNLLLDGRVVIQVAPDMFLVRVPSSERDAEQRLHCAILSTRGVSSTRLGIRTGTSPQELTSQAGAGALQPAAVDSVS